MAPRQAAIVTAGGILIAGLTLLGPAPLAVLAHSQLVTSAPAAGEVAAQPPGELRLVFSEPVDATHTSLDLLGPDGVTLASAVGTPGPDDPFSLLAPLEPLADGVYTVEWRALSAADGHTTSGFFTFGVGRVEPPLQSGAASGGGSIHAGHDAGTTVLETESRIAGDLGFLLAAGLPVIALLVLRRRDSAGVAKAVAGGLALGALGAAGLLLLAGVASGVDVVSYATSSRTGQLLLLRLSLGLLGGGVVLALARRRPGTAGLFGGIVGLLGLVLVAAGGHAAAFASPAPIVAIVVHLVAISIWLAGILSLATVAVLRGPSASASAVPRFSALALVAVALIAVTGVYSDWVQTRELVSFETPYAATLAIKSGLALGAFTLGARSFVSGGKDRPFRRRVVAESGLALAVLVATGVLASGSPPAQERPVAIEPAAPSVAAGPTATLELAPGRPGPTRFIATLPSPVDHELVELQLQRLDASGESRVELQAVSGRVGEYASAGGLLPAGSRWDASVVARGHEGAELSRTRFSFALDGVGVSEGRASPPVDVPMVLAVGLLLAAVLGIAFTLGGGALPRVDRSIGRLAVLSGSLVGAALGVVLLLGGPRL